MKVRPNILIFMTDQQQAQVTQGNHPCHTPHLDRLAAEGVRFDNAFTTMAHCCPSRASFMTGLYPSQHGVHNNVSTVTAINRELQSGVVTFAERLKEQGYSLHFSGKWHISATENPADRGWEELLVTAGKDAVMDPSLETYARMSQTDDAAERLPGWIRRPGWGDYQLYGVAEAAPQHDTDHKAVERAIERLQGLRESKEPWCMYIGTFGPHDPFVIPETYAGMYDPNHIELPPNYWDTLEGKPALYRRMRTLWNQLSEAEVKESIAYYWGYCTMVDELFGRVLDELEAGGQADDTMVVFISDHGESLGSHGLYLKGISPYDETYRIPCIVRWPNGVKHPGRTVNELISIMDFAPTFLDAAGHDAHRQRSAGKSLLPWLMGEAPPNWREAIFTQCNGVEIYYSQRIVRTKQYKLVYNPADTDELYDLHDDPDEMHNRINDPKLYEVKQSLFAAMWREAAAAGDFIFNSYPTVALAEVGPASGLGDWKGIHRFAQ